MASSQLGYIVAWPISRGLVAQTPVVNQIQDLYMESGSVFLSQLRLFVSDPSFRASIVSLSSDLTVREEAHTVVANQSAICWAAQDQALGAAYAIDAGKNGIYKLDAATGAFEKTITVTGAGGSTAGGLVDSTVNDGLLYVLAPTPGIVVVDLKTERQVQYLDLSAVAARQGLQGLAVYGSCRRLEMLPV